MCRTSVGNGNKMHTKKVYLHFYFQGHSTDYSSTLQFLSLLRLRVCMSVILSTSRTITRASGSRKVSNLYFAPLGPLSAPQPPLSSSFHRCTTITIHSRNKRFAKSQHPHSLLPCYLSYNIISPKPTEISTCTTSDAFIIIILYLKFRRG